MTPMERQLQAALQRLESEFSQHLTASAQREAELSSTCAMLQEQLDDVTRLFQGLSRQVTSLAEQSQSEAERAQFLTEQLSDLTELLSNSRRR